MCVHVCLCVCLCVLCCVCACVCACVLPGNISLLSTVGNNQMLSAVEEGVNKPNAVCADTVNQLVRRHVHAPCIVNKGTTYIVP